MEKLIQQGAEAKIILNNGIIIKDRVSKSYRIKELDDTIRKKRTKSEAKLLTKASEIVNAPVPFFIPDGSYQIKMPYIKGKKLSEYLDNFTLKEQKEICKEIGSSVAKLHKSDIIHGDLTTSNMILVEDNFHSDKKIGLSLKDFSSTNLNKSERRMSEQISAGGRVGKNPDYKIFFIDFGLGYISKKIEDKAVDLHLLKHALEAKHFKNANELIKEVLKIYKKNYSEAEKIFERITAIEKRGRYRH